VKRLILGAVAAIGLALGFAPSDASAAWVTRTSYRWDPYCSRYIAYEERVWVPDRHDHHHHHHHRDPVYYRGYDRHDRGYSYDRRPFELDLRFGLPFRR
jgi:hypothetical protein